MPPVMLKFFAPGSANTDPGACGATQKMYYQAGTPRFSEADTAFIPLI